jgi:hypothetical protein
MTRKPVKKAARKARAPTQAKPVKKAKKPLAKKPVRKIAAPLAPGSPEPAPAPAVAAPAAPKRVEVATTKPAPVVITLDPLAEEPRVIDVAEFGEFEEAEGTAEGQSDARGVALAAPSQPEPPQAVAARSAGALEKSATLTRTYVRLGHAGEGTRLKNGLRQATLTFTSEQFERLREAADRDGVSLSEKARRCILGALS